MTKTAITRGRLQEISEDGFLKHGESKELARMALAAMDSEPDCKERKLFCSTDTTRMRKTISVSAWTEDAQLYRHAQPAPVVQCPFPCGWDNLNKLAIQDAALVARGLVEGELTTEAHRQAAISNNDRLLKVISACRAAMLQAEPVSNSDELPLDYLQGHKDGLEWAAQLSESNHPETGDWLYDDPIELAKAIRKGPDMPPAQPVADSEPDRNPVLAYADSYRDMAKQGVESVPIWSVITDIERNIAPLYRHAQPAPVVPDAATAIRACLSEFPESARDIVEECADIAENACRAAMLQAGNSPAQSDCCPAQNDVAPAQSPIDHGYLPECECSGCKATARICAELAGNSQVIPDGYVMVPKEPTEAMMLHNSGCQHHAWDDPDCAMRQTRRLIWSHMLAAAPQEVK